jgi:hypothetical protein
MMDVFLLFLLLLLLLLLLLFCLFFVYPLEEEEDDFIASGFTNFVFPLPHVLNVVIIIFNVLIVASSQRKGGRGLSGLRIVGLITCFSSSSHSATMPANHALSSSTQLTMYNCPSGAPLSNLIFLQFSHHLQRHIAPAQDPGPPPAAAGSAAAAAAAAAAAKPYSSSCFKRLLREGLTG